MLRPWTADLDARDVVAGEVQLWPVSLVAGEHDGASHVGVLQPQAVSDLVHCNLHTTTVTDTRTLFLLKALEIGMLVIPCTL